MTRSVEDQLADQARDRAEHEAIVQKSLSFPSYHNWRMLKAGLGCLVAAFVLWKLNLGGSNELWQLALAAGSFLVITGLFPVLIACGFWIIAIGAIASPALVSGGGIFSVSWEYWVVAGILSLLGIVILRSSKLE